MGEIDEVTYPIWDQVHWYMGCLDDLASDMFYGRITLREASDALNNIRQQLADCLWGY